MKIVFAYLSSFSGAGGIERYNKCFMKALSEAEFITEASFLSLNDTVKDEQYVGRTETFFKGCGGNKALFLWCTYLKMLRADIFVVGHINLSVLVFLARIFNPKLRCVFIIHGVEVWRKLSFIQRYVLTRIPEILTVSRYTAETIIDRYAIDKERITVINNMIDPYINVVTSFEKPAYLLDKYNLHGKRILLTVCRIKSTEKDKGYDKVLEALPDLLNQHRDLMYVLVGKYDEIEKKRLDEICKRLNITANVIFTGYVKDSELEDHYKLGDIFVMPSKKEGFGIVFIEALLHGLLVIAGNKDGSVDALDNGRLGCLINPDDMGELKESINRLIPQIHTQTVIDKKNLQRMTLDLFGYEVYKSKLIDFMRKNKIPS